MAKLGGGGPPGRIQPALGAAWRQPISVEGLRMTALAEPLDRVVDEGRPQEIPGVGDAIADITKLHRTGTHPSLEKLRQEVPEGVLARIPCVTSGLRSA
jgi:hypothetical protein